MRSKHKPGSRCMPEHSRRFPCRDSPTMPARPAKRYFSSRLRRYLYPHGSGGTTGESPIEHVRSSLFPSGLGLTDFNEQALTLRISSSERAMLECLDLAPAMLDLVECFQLMEGLVNLRPKPVQELLAACNSVKARRLFLYMAEKAGHRWLNAVNVSNLDLGVGERSLAKGGVYVSKYHLVLPKELAGI